MIIIPYIISMSKLDYYIGLIFGCPKGETDKDCPLIDIRKMDVHDRLKWWNSLTVEQKTEIIVHHLNCTNKPMNKS